MAKFTFLVLFLTIQFFAGTSCQKPEIIQQSDTIQKENVLQRGENNPLYQMVVAYLIAQRDTSTQHYANKIDTLLSNLSDENMIVIVLDENTDVIVCDLDDYKNAAIDEYTNVYYKAYFTVIGGQVSGGMIYTIYTNSSKGSIDSDFENIFLHKSTTFTGELEVNYLNDRFAQGTKINNGQLEQDYSLSPVNESGQATNSSGDCTNWYLVTTTWYSDGHIETDWEFLYTICNSCIPTGRRVSTLYSDCDPNNSGGGGGASDQVVSEEDAATIITFESELLSNGEEGPNQRKVTYNAHVRWLYDIKLKYFYNIIGGQPYAVPGSWPFTDENGNPASVHIICNPWVFIPTILTVNSFYAYWDFFAKWNYVFINGTIPKMYPRTLTKICVHS